MKTLWIAGLLGITLIGGGCATQNQLQLAETAYNAEVKACNAQHPDNTKKPVTPLLRCLQHAEDKFIATVEPASGAQTRLFRSKTLVAAEKYDKGQTTREEFLLAVRQARADYETALARRTHAAEIAYAASRQADAAQAQARATEELARKKN